MEHTPEFYEGSPVDPTDLRYREAFLNELWETIEREHIVLAAPRRTGKTSVMDHMRDNPRNDWMVINVNVQDQSSPSEFFLSILDAFHDKYPEYVRKILSSGIQIVGNALKAISKFEYAGFKISLRDSDPNWDKNWRVHGENLLERIRSSERKVLIIIDELPDMILNMKKEDEKTLMSFLSWFRNQRQNPSPSKDKVRWLIGGSINLSGTLDALGRVDLINDFVNIELPSLTGPQVENFVFEMLSKREVVFAEDIPSLVRMRLGRPIPLIMQMATHDLYRLWKRYGKKLKKQDVDTIFEELITRSSARDKLQHYYSRIKNYYDEPNEAAAFEILSSLSSSPTGIKRVDLRTIFDDTLKSSGIKIKKYIRTQLFNQLMMDLENDFYIMKTDTKKNHYDFASGTLKDWWRKYHA